jgi:hypothetical protein
VMPRGAQDLAGAEERTERIPHGSRHFQTGL